VARAPAAGQRRSVRRALDDELERARLRRCSARGWTPVSGYLLPLREWRSARRPAWQTGPWFLRDERCT
jgi:uncharacterized protein (DUF2126 family)